MEAYFVDDRFFAYLMKQVYRVWDDFLPYIGQLPDDRMFYLQLPFPLLSNKYGSNANFVREWSKLRLNRNKKIIVSIGGRRWRYSNRARWYGNGNIATLRVVIQLVTLVSGPQTFLDWDWDADGKLTLAPTASEVTGVTARVVR